MLDIYICDDITKQLDYFEKTIRNYILFKDWGIENIYGTTDPFDILERIKTTNNTGIYFLDIELNAHINGLELARQIRERDNTGYIIFITTHEEMMAVTFQYQLAAMDFIIKDTPQQIKLSIERALATAYSRYFQGNSEPSKLMSFRMSAQTLLLEPHKIYYFSVSAIPHQVEIHTANEINSVYGSLNDFEKKVPQYFFRCDRKHLINLTNILSFVPKSQCVIMKNYAELHVSIRNKNKLSKALDSLKL